MKTIIVYKSFLGTTKKYARWLASDLKANIFTFSQAKDELLEKYDTVIVASGTYASWMPLTGFLKRKWKVLKGKKVIVISVGISPPGVEYTEQTFRKIPKDIFEQIKIIRLPGSMFGFTPPETGEVKKDNIEEVKKLLINT